MDELTRLKGNVESASSDVTNLSTSAPDLLKNLKSNLTGIFTKDNPIFGARESALEQFLRMPDATRSALLPNNLPVVEGSNLNLSPTQQQSIVSSRNAAAFAPLAGFNNIITGQYGTIADAIGNAANLYQSQIEAGKQKYASALELYKMALDDEQKKRELAARSSGSSGIGIADIMSILSAMGLSDNTNGNDGGNLDLLVEPDQGLPATPKTMNFYQNLLNTGNSPTPAPTPAPTMSQIFPTSNPLNPLGLRR